ncbi:MAG: hypothetical protein IJ740_14145 [Ruminococcus sp.]|nr:hypothetical protein [Ruminococcus sp.]
MKPRKRLRKILSLLFVLLSVSGAAANGAVYHMCTQNKITYMQGFLTGIPVAIAMFWCSCFFDDASLIKQDSGNVYIFGRVIRRIISLLLTLLCIAAVFFWVYMYHTKIAPLF